MFHTFFGFDGRMNRKPFLLSYLLLIVLTIVAYFILLPASGLTVGEMATPTPDTLRKMTNLTLILTLIVFWPTLALLVKRFHDRGKSSWWAIVLYGVTMISTLANAAILNGIAALPAGLTLDQFNLGMTALSAIAGIWLLVELVFMRGTIGPNAYGPDPVARADIETAAADRSSGDWAG